MRVRTSARTPSECDDTEMKRWRERKEERVYNDDKDATTKDDVAAKGNIKQSFAVAALFSDMTMVFSVVVVVVLLWLLSYVQLFRLCDRWANRFDRRNSNQNFRSTCFTHAPTINSILWQLMHKFRCRLLCCCRYMLVGQMTMNKWDIEKLKEYPLYIADEMNTTAQPKKSSKQ